MGKTVLLGMSGGVDSSASAIILRDKGYDVTGATYILTDDINFKKTAEDAKKTAKEIGIKHIILDYRKDFESMVINQFTSEYLKGRTPNPCVVCNKNIKFKKFIETADELGIEYVSSGQYADIEMINGKYNIIKPADKQKDQTYFLYTLNQESIKRIIFPLGKVGTKDLTREIVKKSGLDIFNKKDSQEICFIKDIKYSDYILKKTNIAVKEGNFIDKKGNVLGRHNGIINYTIGQRRGLGIALGKPAFVTNINFLDNTVTLGNEDDLLSDNLNIYDYNFIDNEFDFSNVSLMAKIRYGAKEEKVKLIKEENHIHVKFENPVRAVTKGQSIVFYDNDILIGGGIIE